MPIPIKPKLSEEENRLLDKIIDADIDHEEHEKEESQDRRGIDGNLA